MREQSGFVPAVRRSNFCKYESRNKSSRAKPEEAQSVALHFMNDMNQIKQVQVQQSKSQYSDRMHAGLGDPQREVEAEFRLVIHSNFHFSQLLKILILRSWEGSI